MGMETSGGWGLVFVTRTHTDHSLHLGSSAEA